MFKIVYIWTNAKKWIPEKAERVIPENFPERNIRIQRNEDEKTLTIESEDGPLLDEIVQFMSEHAVFKIHLTLKKES